MLRLKLCHLEKIPVIHHQVVTQEEQIQEVHLGKCLKLLIHEWIQLLVSVKIHVLCILTKDSHQHLVAQLEGILGIRSQQALLEVILEEIFLLEQSHQQELIHGTCTEIQECRLLTLGIQDRTHEFQ